MDVLYKRIRERREFLGLSQTELAEKLGYKSRSSINKIELGENDIPQSKIEAFARALSTTPSYLMGWDITNEVPNEKEVHTLAAHFDGDEYTKEELEEIKQFAEFVKNRKSKKE